MQIGKRLFILSTLLGCTALQASPLRGQTRALGRDSTLTLQAILLQRERFYWEALKNADSIAVARAMPVGTVDVDASGVRRASAASIGRFVAGCRTRSFAISDPHVVISTATAVVSYRVAADQTCWGQEAPSPLYVLTVYERRTDDWFVVAHSETPARF